MKTNARLMERRNRPAIRNGQRGAMLLEALIGILIFSMGILAMIGLQATAVRMNTGSKERAARHRRASAASSRGGKNSTENGTRSRPISRRRSTTESAWRSAEPAVVTSTA